MLDVRIRARLLLAGLLVSISSCTPPTRMSSRSSAPPTSPALEESPPEPVHCTEPTNLKGGFVGAPRRYLDLDLDAMAARLPTDPRDLREPGPPVSVTVRKPQLTEGVRSPIPHHTRLGPPNPPRDDRSYLPHVARLFPADGTASQIRVTDMQTICTCEPGMGEARLAYAVRNGFSVETYEGQRAAVSADGRQLQAWAGDRCEVSIWADSKRRLRAIANETDWSGLEALCSARTLAAAL